MVIMIQKMGIMIQKYICPKIGKVGELRLMSTQVTADVHLIFLGGAHLTFFSLESGILSRCLLGPLTFSTVFFFVQVDNSMFLISFQALVASIGLCICTFNVSAFIQVQHTGKNYYVCPFSQIVTPQIHISEYQHTYKSTIQILRCPSSTTSPGLKGASDPCWSDLLLPPSPNLSPFSPSTIFW